MDWDKLRVFYAVASAGSLTHAEEALHISHSAISRHIQQLEADLKTPLFHRHARGLHLTGAGEILLGTVQDIYSNLERTKNRIIANTDSPQGPLRVSTTLGFGTAWLTPRIREFIERFPKMQVQLLFGDNMLDIAMGEADVAIRLQKPKQGDIICTPFMRFSYALYASENYLSQHGVPESFSDLDNHNLIVLDETSPLSLDHFNWILTLGGTRSAVLAVNNPYGIYRALLGGLGIGSLPNFIVSSGDGLRCLPLPDSSIAAQAYFIYPVELRRTKRIQAFKDFMLEKAEEFLQESHL